MNIQEIFNKVVTFIFWQGQQSLDTEEGCAYRGLGNLKCAVGCLIEDRHYDKDIEDHNSDDPEVLALLEKSIGRELSKEEQDLLYWLQTKHDCAVRGSVSLFREGWETNCKALAEKFKLQMPELKEIPDETSN